MSLSIPLFDVNLFLSHFELFLRAEVLDLLRRNHEESLVLSFLLPQLDMLQSQGQLGKTAYDERLHL